MEMDDGHCFSFLLLKKINWFLITEENQDTALQEQDMLMVSFKFSNFQIFKLQHLQIRD
ncbi:hypothetical protein ZOSMA_414G00010 [Zostera marina]|uniref:Uncharacterized protein n=1 Tax=Zostera marina TaxID=29655 RepID=A0A0K9P2Z1_ZOSMR|nr:hypothetical protein ZOSMA_414G00010 [Zostera marina]